MDGMLFVHQSCASSVEKPAKEAGVLHVATFIAAAGAAYAFATAPEMNLVILGLASGLMLLSCYLTSQLLGDSRLNR
ncbi:MAG: hypothetical protein J0G36_00600 [Afipia sp.]|nr:hypothetical protein [Afipia sp.]